jgi:hypothetical protein
VAINIRIFIDQAPGWFNDGARHLAPDTTNPSFQAKSIPAWILTKPLHLSGQLIGLAQQDSSISVEFFGEQAKPFSANCPFISIQPNMR